MLSVWIDENSEQLDVTDLDIQAFHTFMKMVLMKMTLLRWQNAAIVANPVIIT